MNVECQRVRDSAWLTVMTFIGIILFRWLTHRDTISSISSK